VIKNLSNHILVAALTTVFAVGSGVFTSTVAAQNQAARPAQSRQLLQPQPPSQPLPVKQVFAHYMVCCPTVGGGATLEDYKQEIQEAQKRGYERIEIIVATLNDDPANLECLQPLVAAAQSGMSKAQIMNEVSDKLSFQAEVYESPDAALDLLDLKGNPDSRLILISNGKGEGTKQMAQQAENISVKVIGYNPEKQEYIGASRPQTAAVKIAAAKGGKDTGR